MTRPIWRRLGKMLGRATRAGAHVDSANAVIEGLESRTLLATDTAVTLSLSYSSNALLPGEQPRDLIFDPTRNQVLAVLHDRVRRYDAADGRMLGSINFGENLNGGDITADGQFLYVAEIDSPNVYKVDLDAGTFSTIAVAADADQTTSGDVAMLMDKAIVSQHPQAPYTTNRIREISLTDDVVGDLWLGSFGPLSFDEYATTSRSADYSTVAITSPNNVYTVNSGVVDGRNLRGYGTIYGAAVSRDGALRAIATASEVIIEDQQFDVLEMIGIGEASVAFDPAADVMYVADPASDLLRAYETTTWTELFAWAIGEDLGAADPYGAGVMAVSEDQTLFLTTASGVRFFDLSPGATFYSAAVTLEAEVTSLAPVGTPEGVVSFIDVISGTTIGQGTLVDGVAELMISSLHAGNYSILAHYEGSLLHNPGDSLESMLVVKRAITTAVVTQTSESTVGFTIASAAGAVPDGGAVVLHYGDFDDTQALSGQSAAFGIVSIGTHQVAGEWGGSSDFLPATSDELEVVMRQQALMILEASATSVVYGQPVTFTATVMPQDVAVGAVVSFMQGSFLHGTAVVDVDGTAVFTVDSPPAGVLIMGAWFAGNGSLAPTNASANEVIVAKATTSVVLTGPGPTVWNNAVELVVNVTGEGGLTVGSGEVVFREGALVLGSAVVEMGQAVLEVSGLSAGIHSITATYTGQDNFAESPASTFALTVLKAATKVTLNRNYVWIPKGQWVQWTANVESIGAGGAAVGTKITFKDGKDVLGTAPIVDGVASFHSRSLPAGDRWITASFGGSAEFSKSASKALKTTVVVGPVVDVMVMYTPAVRDDVGGDVAAVERARESVLGTNLALWNSRIALTIRLVHSGLVNYTESGRLGLDLKRLTGTGDGYMDAVHKLRNERKADLVSLMESDGDAGGIAWELTDVDDPSNPSYGFSIVLAHQAAGPWFSLAHEFGHNLGASHDPANANGPGATSYSYGYRFRTGDGTQYHDIMAYDPGLTIPYFSNPRVKFKGVWIGTAKADAARTITLTAPYVARYRR